MAEPLVRLDFPGLDFHLEGWSVAGVETRLRVPQWSLQIDCGGVDPAQVHCRHLALTHAHLDHAGGIAGWLGLRQMLGHEPADVYAPIEVAAALESVVETWSRLQGVAFGWTMHPARPGDGFDLGGGRRLVAHAADHRVPALGWSVVDQRRRLLPELHTWSGEAIADLRRRGHVVDAPHDVALLAVSGDSGPAPARDVAALRDAAVVVHEVTLLDAAHPPALARAGGHSHLFDLDDACPIAANARYFVPYHLSARYTPDQAQALLSAALGRRFGARLRPLLAL